MQCQRQADDCFKKVKDGGVVYILFEKQMNQEIQPQVHSNGRRYAPPREPLPSLHWPGVMASITQFCAYALYSLPKNLLAVGVICFMMLRIWSERSS